MRRPTYLMSLRTILKVALIWRAGADLYSRRFRRFIFSCIYYHSLEEEVVTRFSQKHWNIPSRIYSDSTIIYPGQTLDDLGFFERLARLNYHRVEPGKVTDAGRVQLRCQARQAGHLPAQLRVSVSATSRGQTRLKSISRATKIIHG